MSSSGINFSGLATGLDTKAIIQALMAVERRPITALEKKKKSLQGERNLFGTLETKLRELETKANALKTASSFLEYKTALDKEEFLSASASTAASAGSYDIEVVDLAKGQVSTTLGKSDKDATTYGTGTFAIQFAEGAPLTITIGSADQTLEGIARAINSQGQGKVTAQVLDTGAGTNRYQLVVNSKDTGAKSAFTFLPDTVSPGLDGLLTELNANKTTTASDAHIKVNGISVYRASNSIGDAIAGVTLNLKGKNTAGQTTKLTVSTDTSAVATKVKEFVDAYNAVVDFAKEQNVLGEDNKPKSALFGDSTLATIRSQLRGIAGSTFDTGDQAFAMLAQVGVKSDRDGKLTFEQAKFEEAVGKSERAVRALFTDTTSGISVRIASTIKTLTDAVDGVIKARRDGYDRLIQSADRQIAQGERRLESYEKYLTNKFAAMENLVSRLNAQGGGLSALNR